MNKGICREMKVPQILHVLHLIYSSLVTYLNSNHVTGNLNFIRTLHLTGYLKLRGKKKKLRGKTLRERLEYELLGGVFS